MRTTLVLTTLVAAACGSPREPLAPHPQGYAGHMEAAEQHAQRADAHRQAARLPDSNVTGAPGGYQCGDTVLADQVTSGGERIAQAIPCWDTADEDAEHHRFVAAREERLAQSERRAAANLVAAERAACRGMPAAELEHSPFAHRKAIASVVAHREGDAVRGVRIIFKPVPGLTADWMRQAIACHRARFERMGEPAGLQPDDPTLVARATTTVELRKGHLEVLVETPDEVNAAVALARAQDLVRPRTAGR